MTVLQCVYNKVVDSLSGISTALYHNNDLYYKGLSVIFAGETATNIFGYKSKRLYSGSTEDL